MGPQNRAESFSYYSAVPALGWRAVVLPLGEEWPELEVRIGASVDGRDFKLRRPENELDSYFPSGRLVHLTGGGIAFEGGIPLPPAVPVAAGCCVALRLAVRSSSTSRAAELRFRLEGGHHCDKLMPVGEEMRRIAESEVSGEVWSPKDADAFPSTPEGAAEGAGQCAVDANHADHLYAQQLLDRARIEAVALGAQEVGDQHLLLAIVSLGVDAAQPLAEVNPDHLRAAVQFLQPYTGVKPAIRNLRVGNRAKSVLKQARELAGASAHNEPGQQELITAIVRVNGRANAALRWLGIEPETLLS